MAPPLLGHSLPPPPPRLDEPDGLGRRKVPDKQVLAPQPRAPRGIAAILMQIHGVIMPGRKEIRCYLALDNPSHVVTWRGGEKSCLPHGKAGCAVSGMHLMCELLCWACYSKNPCWMEMGGVDALSGTWVLALVAFGQQYPKQPFKGGVAWPQSGSGPPWLCWCLSSPVGGPGAAPSPCCGTREPVVLQASSIAPAYTQGLRGFWKRGKKCVNEGRGEEEDESQPSSCWHASPHPFLQLSGAQLHSLATGPTSASPSPIWLRTN